MTLHQLQCFDAVVAEGGFQAAAAKLNRTHPTVYTAVKSLEQELGVTLFDRSGYRVVLTPAGRSFHAKVRRVLAESQALGRHAEQLAMGEESDLSIVIGDLCPLRETLGLLKDFFEACPQTRLHIRIENLTGPLECLSEGEADLMFHYVEQDTLPLERISTGTVRIVPLVAPGFLRIPVTRSITPDAMRDYVQCIIRDSAKRPRKGGYYLIDGARSWTVGDQATKKEIILQGMGWGHLPSFMVESELRAGKLLSIAGRHLRTREVALVAARRADTPHGPVAQRLWQFIDARARTLARAAKPSR